MVWDERKRAINLLPEPEGHGLDFLDARDRFEWDSALVVPTYPGPDGRARFMAIGWLDGHLRALVFAPLGTQAVSASASVRPVEGRGASMMKRKAGPISDAEEARIQAAIARDPDAPEVTDAQAAQARPASDVLDPALYANLTRRGRPRSEASKKLVTLRLPPDVIAGYQASGPGWQIRMGEVLAAGLATDQTAQKTKRRG